MAQSLKRSPLDDRHRSLGATMVPFGGWEMPIEYEGTVGEHMSVRDAAGIFDVSHLGKVMVAGDEAAGALDRALSNRIADLRPGRARYSLILDDDGGIIDDLIVYALEGGRFLVVPNAANRDRVAESLRAVAGAGATVSVLDWCTIAVQGPRSPQLVARFAGAGELGYMRCTETSGIVVSRSGYTGEVGYEVFAPAEQAPRLWDELLDAVRAAGGRPCGLGARDTLRLEMGYPLHGNDMDPDTTPREADLEWAVAMDKPSFTGKAAVLASRPRKRLVGLRMDGRGIPRHGHPVLSGGVRIGTVTSGNFSPVLRTGIALAAVDPGMAKEGGSVEIDIRGKVAGARVVRPPFVDRSPKG